MENKEEPKFEASTGARQTLYQDCTVYNYSLTDEQFGKLKEEWNRRLDLIFNKAFIEQLKNLSPIKGEKDA